MTPTDPKLIEQIIAAHATPMSQDAVRRKLGISKQLVSRVLNERGLVRYGPGTTGRRRPPLVDRPEKAAEIVRLYRAGSSCNAVAIELGVSASVCRVVIQFYAPGLIRTRTESQKMAAKNFDPFRFVLSDMGLRPSRSPCANERCAMAFLIPIEASEDIKRKCPVCAAPGPTHHRSETSLRRSRTKWLKPSTPLAPTSCSSDSRRRSRSVGWRRCATGSTLRC